MCQGKVASDRSLADASPAKGAGLAPLREPCPFAKRGRLPPELWAGVGCRSLCARTAAHASTAATHEPQLQLMPRSPVIPGGRPPRGGGNGAWIPYSSGIRESRFPLRELRVQSRGHPIRVFYAFDPWGQAVLLIAGDKTGDDRFYETLRRENHLVSTLRRYVEALGGELEIVASFGDKRVRLQGI